MNGPLEKKKILIIFFSLNILGSEVNDIILYIYVYIYI
jgi:hypothetical protein